MLRAARYLFALLAISCLMAAWLSIDGQLLGAYGFFFSMIYMALQVVQFYVEDQIELARRDRQSIKKSPPGAVSPRPSPRDDSPALRGSFTATYLDIGQKR